MTFISMIREFLNPVSLAGIIILTRFVTKPVWAIIIGTALVILGLLSFGIK